MSASNILAPGRRRRIVNGVVVTVLAIAASVIVVVRSASPLWGVAIFALVFLAALLLIQARDGT